MILDVPPHQLVVIEQASQLLGQDLNDYAKTTLYRHAKALLANKPKSVADLVQGKQLDGFNGDLIVTQRQMRDEYRL